jgi:hypothetical protein
MAREILTPEALAAAARRMEEIIAEPLEGQPPGARA